jgi:hypothetical protein
VAILLSSYPLNMDFYFIAKAPTPSKSADHSIADFPEARLNEALGAYAFACSVSAVCL